jgi:hypothetical protein
MNSLVKSAFIIPAYVSALLGAPNVFGAPLEARATTLYFFGGTDPLRESGTTRGGTWSLGQNRATVGLTPNIQPAGGPLTGTYAGGGDFVLAEKSEGDTTATARSEISINAPGTADCPGKLYCYALEAKATTQGGLFRFSKPADAVARGKDPQQVLSPGIFGQTISLLPGSSIFESRPEIDEADSILTITAPDLTEALATIHLQAIGGMVDATVTLASDSRLRFFDLMSLSTLDKDAVESILESSSALRTSTGLSSGLRLFSYEFDLTGATLSSDAAFAAETVNLAASPISEPHVLGLMLMGFTGIMYTRRRQQPV